MKPEQITAWALDEASAAERQQLEAALLENPTDKQKADETKAFCDFLLTELRDDSLALTDKQRARLVAHASQPQSAAQSSPVHSANGTHPPQPAARPPQTKWRFGVIVRLSIAACAVLGGFWTWQTYSEKHDMREVAHVTAPQKPGVKVQLAPKRKAGQGPEARLLADTSTKATIKKMEPQPGKPMAPVPAPAAAPAPAPVAAAPALALNTDQPVMTPGDVTKLKQLQDQNAYALNFGGRMERPAEMPVPASVSTLSAAPPPPAAQTTLAAAPMPTSGTVAFSSPPPSTPTPAINPFSGTLAISNPILNDWAILDLTQDPMNPATTTMSQRTAVLSYTLSYAEVQSAYHSPLMPVPVGMIASSRDHAMAGSLAESLGGSLAGFRLGMNIGTPVGWSRPLTILGGATLGSEGPLLGLVLRTASERSGSTMLQLGASLSMNAFLRSHQAFHSRMGSIAFLGNDFFNPRGFGIPISYSGWMPRDTYENPNSGGVISFATATQSRLMTSSSDVVASLGDHAMAGSLAGISPSLGFGVSFEPDYGTFGGLLINPSSGWRWPLSSAAFLVLRAAGTGSTGSVIVQAGAPLMVDEFLQPRFAPIFHAGFMTLGNEAQRAAIGTYAWSFHTNSTGPISFATAAQSRLTDQPDLDLISAGKLPMVGVLFKNTTQPHSPGMGNASTTANDMASFNGAATAGRAGVTQLSSDIGGTVIALGQTSSLTSTTQSGTLASVPVTRESTSYFDGVDHQSATASNNDLRFAANAGYDSNYVWSQSRLGLPPPPPVMPSYDATRQETFNGDFGNGPMIASTGGAVHMPVASGTLTLSGGTATTTATTAPAPAPAPGLGNTTFSGTVSGAGAVAKSGAGILTLSGANTYTGSTTISGGAIVTGSSAASEKPVSGWATTNATEFSTFNRAAGAAQSSSLSFASVGATVTTPMPVSHNPQPTATLGGAVVSPQPGAAGQLATATFTNSSAAPEMPAGPPAALGLIPQSDTRYFSADSISTTPIKDLPQLQQKASTRRSEATGESYTRIIENELKDVAREPLSTLSIDVDTASYANVRRFLNQNMIPPPDAVRIEELVNYFPTAEEGPAHDAKEPFGVRIELAPCPWQPVHRLARIAIKGREMDKNRKPSNLVFLVDVSGSMNEPAKLPLVQQSLRMLTSQLGEGDHVTIVVYAGSSGVVLPPTSGEKKADILAAIDRLSAGGSTHGSAGIKRAYEQAVAGFIKGGVNRVILCTDGDFNVGVSSPEELEKLIKNKAKTGVFLSVLGFGSGNLQDRTMETLADKGNGNYAYIDSLSEARKVLVEQMGSTLETIAKDVKIQVEFNPAAVRSYRLIGYENRLLAKEDFNDDTKDAGEIGAGHSVVALYEIVPANLPPGTEPRPAVDQLKYQAQAPAISPAQLAEAAKSGEMMTVKLRYKAPDSDLSKLIEVPTKDEGKTLTASSDEFKFSAAVAGFGLLLRDSAYQGNLSWETVRRLALDGKGADKLGYRGEFLQLIDKARGLKETR